MLALLPLLTLVAAASASHAIHSFDECYREGDIVLDGYDRCRYRTCARVEPEHGYAHFALRDRKCAEGTGVPYFLLHQYKHGVYGGHRFIGSHLASAVCSDHSIKDCTATYGYGYGYPAPAANVHPGYGHGYGHGQFAYGYPALPAVVAPASTKVSE